MSIRQLTVGILVLLCGCHTIGMSREKGGYADIAAPVAHEMIIDTSQVVVVDFRDTGEYEAGHIAGALSSPLSSIEHQLPELIPYQSSTLLVYGDNRDQSVRGARLLVAAGFRNVVLITGGINEWIADGFPTVSSR
ncbi:MAG: rhodanese-like domain-containing protein [Acidobacteriota bacterium]